MSIDWQKEVEARKDALLEDLFAVLEIPSVREDDKATEDAPVGPGPKAALLKFLDLAERDGFVTKNVDNLAGHIEYGEGKETLGVFGHVDVVPVGSGWNTDPFKPVIVDGKVMARGASDDKGPSVAAYYGLKIIKELNLPITKKIRFIIGTDEESGWMCMDRYFEGEEKPDFGFSPDADFPIINGEKGNTTAYLHFSGTDHSGSYRLKNFQSGQRINMVPEKAVATVLTSSTTEAQEVSKAYQTFLTEQPVDGSVEVRDEQVELYCSGKAAHAMEPKNGINAATYLAVFLKNYDFASNAKQFIATIANYLHEDSRAHQLGIAYTDEKMGELTMNPGLFSFTDGAADNTIALNFRFPQGQTPENIRLGIQQALNLSNDCVTEGGHTQMPHYVPIDDPLVQTLLNVYQDHTGQRGAERVIGGGTFGRLLKRGVAYGALFPHSVDTMHQANEYMTVDDLLKAAAIYGDAIYRLLK